MRVDQIIERAKIAKDDLCYNDNSSDMIIGFIGRRDPWMENGFIYLIKAGKLDNMAVCLKYYKSIQDDSAAYCYQSLVENIKKATEEIQLYEKRLFLAEIMLKNFNECPINDQFILTYNSLLGMYLFGQQIVRKSENGTVESFVSVKWLTSEDKLCTFDRYKALTGNYKIEEFKERDFNYHTPTEKMEKGCIKKFRSKLKENISEQEKHIRYCKLFISEKESMKDILIYFYQNLLR